MPTRCKKRGFTLLELITIVAIIGLIIAIFITSLETSRQKGRDANRATQLQEFLKAFELYYLEHGQYPSDGILDPGVATPFYHGSQVGDAITASDYLTFVPPDPTFSIERGYLYCASNDGRSIALLVNTERDREGTDYCVVGRGSVGYSGSMCTVPEPAGGDPIPVSAIDRCANRF